MCLSGHVGMMAAGNNEGRSLVSFRRCKSRSTRAEKIGKAFLPHTWATAKDKRHQGMKWEVVKQEKQNKRQSRFIVTPKKSVVCWWKRRAISYLFLFEQFMLIKLTFY